MGVVQARNATTAFAHPKDVRQMATAVMVDVVLSFATKLSVHLLNVALLATNALLVAAATI